MTLRMKSMMKIRGNPKQEEKVQMIKDTITKPCLLCP
jgi:hypothetical protein